MTTERDTHFANAAKLLADAIDLISEEWVITPGKDAEKLIAQFAYDLACHVFYYTEHGLGRFNIPEQVNERIPDLTEWPPTKDDTQ
jgi:hypothetical protein